MSLSNLLQIFKDKIEDAAALVQQMDIEDKSKAVELWNIISEQLQIIVNNSAQEIPEYIDASQLAELGLAPSFTSGLESDTFATPVKSQDDLALAAAVGAEDVCTEVVTHTGGENNIQLSPFTSEGAGCKQELMEPKTAPLQQLTKIKDREDTTSIECQTEEVNGSEIPDDLEGNTVHLMISAESNPTTVTNSSVQNEKIDTDDKVADVADDPEGDSHEEYECRYCEMKFNAPSQLSAHTWIHTKPYVCPTCGSRFASKGNLVVHLRRHTGERPFTCSLCGARFSTHGNLARHRKSHSGEKPWKCDECGSSFVEHKSLKVHMRRHTGERPYVCHICQKSFTQTGILQTHLAMHMDQRAYKCMQCARRFRQKSQLRLHEQRHAGIRKYQCSVCGYKFLTKGDMERHQRTHTGERPFTCKLCNKSFTRQQSLNEHLNRHYGLKPYQCKYCNKGYVEMSACYKHIKTHERGKDSPESQPKLPSQPKAKSQPKQKNNDEVLSSTVVPPTVVAATAPDSDKIVFLVQNNVADKGASTTHPVDLTTVIIQRVPDSIDSEESQSK